MTVCAGPRAGPIGVHTPQGWLWNMVQGLKASLHGTSAVLSMTSSQLAPSRAPGSPCRPAAQPHSLPQFGMAHKGTSVVLYRSAEIRCVGGSSASWGCELERGCFDWAASWMFWTGGSPPADAGCLLHLPVYLNWCTQQGTHIAYWAAAGAATSCQARLTINNLPIHPLSISFVFHPPPTAAQEAPVHQHHRLVGRAVHQPRLCRQPVGRANCHRMGVHGAPWRGGLLADHRWGLLRGLHLQGS